MGACVPVKVVRRRKGVGFGGLGGMLGAVWGGRSKGVGRAGRLDGIARVVVECRWCTKIFPWICKCVCVWERIGEQIRERLQCTETAWSGHLIMEYDFVVRKQEARQVSEVSDLVLGVEEDGGGGIWNMEV